MSKLSKRHFWKWFQRNNTTYLDLHNSSKKEAAYWINELNTHLRAYGRFYSFVLSVSNQHTGTLTISVDGKPHYFKKADTLVALAPDIPAWTIISLEAPMSVDPEMEMLLADAGIGLDELYFSFAGNADEYNSIIVYHTLCNDDTYDLFYRIAHAVVYNLLGERSFGVDIADIDVANLSEADGAELWKLEELPSRIITRQSLFVVTETGMLKLISGEGKG
ncbi:hypothetical protein [Sediminibacterium sp.]|uniref:hypothetical protein n=1 Tax=Sediminibacterium sp. TaxID=1917865 RepID=UPI0025D5AAF1|nr:hypothetical protein [Sediminibacterium sp.]MBW0177568.1 hypothetical protein [Sediminibacterium sp.]